MTDPGNLLTVERIANFCARLPSGDGCWLWPGVIKKGYGTFKATLGGRQGYLAAHRVSYWIFYGPFDPAMHVLHSCDMPGCVNPAHLWLGTNQQNIEDKMNKGRQVARLPGIGKQLSFSRKILLLG